MAPRARSVFLEWEQIGPMLGSLYKGSCYFGSILRALIFGNCQEESAKNMAGLLSVDVCTCRRIAQGTKGLNRAFGHGFCEARTMPRTAWAGDQACGMRPPLHCRSVSQVCQSAISICSYETQALCCRVKLKCPSYARKLDDHFDPEAAGVGSLGLSTASSWRPGVDSYFNGGRVWSSKGPPLCGHEQRTE